MEKLVSCSYHQCFLTSYPELHRGGGGLLQLTCTSAHTERGQVHAAHRGVSGIPPHTHLPGRGLSPFVMVNERSAWLHFLIPFPPRLRWGPATHCTAVISLTPSTPHPPFFFHSREVWPIMLSHIPLFNSLHATLPHLWHPTPALHNTPHHTPCLPAFFLSWSSTSCVTGTRDVFGKQRCRLETLTLS